MPTLHICTTCRAGMDLKDGDTPQGTHMLNAVTAAAGPGVDVRPITCLASCEQGCAAVISMPGKWTYLLGRLHPAMAADLVAYAGTYATHPTGTVLPSRRPASLARVILGRVPDLAGAA